MDKLDELTVFVAVVQQGSLAAAARKLRRSPPAITRALASLENRFAASLIERTTRNMSPTPAGIVLFERAKTLLNDYQQAIQDSSKSQLNGLLRITAPVQFGRKHLAPVVLDFIDRYPGIQVELLLNDSYQDLLEQGLDIAVRIGQLRDSSLVAVETGTVQRILLASPEYLARAGCPATPADLAAHSLIAGTSVSSLREWRFGPAGNQERVRIQPTFMVNEVETQLIAARAGKGITRLLSYQAFEDLQHGTLCEVMPESRPAALPVQLVTQNLKYMPAKVRAFWDIAREALSALTCLQTESMTPVKKQTDYWQK
ncbi:LysR family transcriptional regulator [Erwinia sp. P6884]|uniref:LysR family transcriptional regulator n=1 Tax=Erwinia sp. P6884 TaxID=3141450 RepID=UPI003191B1D7